MHGCARVRQIRIFLSKKAVRVIDLFHEWDDDRSGNISRAEFCKAMVSLGLEAPMEVFESLDRILKANHRLPRAVPGPFPARFLTIFAQKCDVAGSSLFMMFQPLEELLGRSWKHLEFLKRHPEGPWALQGGKCVSKRAPKAAQEGPG